MPTDNGRVPRYTVRWPVLAVERGRPFGALRVDAGGRGRTSATSRGASRRPARRAPRLPNAPRALAEELFREARKRDSHHDRTDELQDPADVGLTAGSDF